QRRNRAVRPRHPALARLVSRPVPIGTNRKQPARPLNANIAHVSSRRAYNRNVLGGATLDLAPNPFGRRPRLAKTSAGKQKPNAPIAMGRKLIWPRNRIPASFEFIFVFVFHDSLTRHVDEQLNRQTIVWDRSAAERAPSCEKQRHEHALQTR